MKETLVLGWVTESQGVCVGAWGGGSEHRVTSQEKKSVKQILQEHRSLQGEVQAVRAHRHRASAA